MASWRDDLQPASFRGVPFEVQTDGGPAGRRTQTHEFVQRDRPFVEDLGRVTREFKLQAFVGGADCFQKRDALLAALDKPGPGELVHPWLGKLTVTAGDGCEYSHDRREGGLVRFTLVFVEDGEKGFPVGTPNTARQVQQANVGLIASAKDAFAAALASVNVGRAKVSTLQGALQAPYNAAAASFSDVQRGVSGVAGFVDALVSSPVAFVGLFSSLGSSASVARLGDFSGFSSGLNALLGKSQSAQSLSGSYAYVGDSTTGRVAQSAQRLVRDALLVQVAADAAAVPALAAPPPLPAVPSLAQQIAQPVARADVPVSDDVLAVRGAVNEAFWAAALEADHDQFNQLEAVRKAVYRHLTDVAAAGVRLVELTPRTTEPALLLAYRRFGDASRAGEIITRNRIRHPGFVPPAALQVAQE